MVDFLNLTQAQSAWLTLIVVAVMFAAFLREVFPTEVVAMAGVSILLVTGVLPYADAVAVLSNPAPSTQ